MKLSSSRLRQIFHEYDSNGKGYLTRRELKLAIIAVFGYKPSSAETRRIIADSGTDKGADRSAGNAASSSTSTESVTGVNLESFLSHCLRRQIKEDSSVEIRHVFNALDSQARGFLTIDDVEAACRRVAPGIGVEAIKSVVAEVDRSGHGRIALGDFFDLYHMAQEMNDEET